MIHSAVGTGVRSRSHIGRSVADVDLAAQNVERAPIEGSRFGEAC